MTDNDNDHTPLERARYWLDCSPDDGFYSLESSITHDLIRDLADRIAELETELPPWQYGYLTDGTAGIVPGKEATATHRRRIGPWEPTDD